MRRALLLLPLAALATGCVANDSRYPSLLPRPIESQTLAEPERPAPIAAPDPELDARLATANAAIDAATRDFNAAAQNTEAMVAVARGMAEGTEPWLNAQTALSELEAKHAPIVTTLSELEELAIARGADGKPDYPALGAAIDRARALSDSQATRIRGLDDSLAGRN